MNRCYAFPRRQFIRCPPRHLVVANLLTQLLHHYTPMVRRIIQCWKTPRQNLTLASSRPRRDRRFLWPWASVHPMLKSLSWRISILIQTKHGIDRQCPHLDCRIIRCYCLHCFFSAIHLTHLETRLSEHPTIPVDLRLLVVYQLH
jgi:hypothetical protein